MPPRKLEAQHPHHQPSEGHVESFQTCQVQVERNRQLQCVFFDLFWFECSMVLRLRWHVDWWRCCFDGRNCILPPVQLAVRWVWSMGRQSSCHDMYLGTSHTLLHWFKLMLSPVLVEWLGSNDEKCRWNPKMTSPLIHVFCAASPSHHWVVVSLCSFCTWGHAREDGGGIRAFGNVDATNTTLLFLRTILCWVLIGATLMSQVSRTAGLHRMKLELFSVVSKSRPLNHTHTHKHTHSVFQQKTLVE